MASAGPRTGRARHRALGWAGVAGLVLGALAVLRGVRGGRVDPLDEMVRTVLKPTSLFDFSESPLGESVRTQVPLRKYQTPELKFVMVFCFDPAQEEAQGHLQDLQALYEKYHPLGLEILGMVGSDLADGRDEAMPGVHFRELLKLWGVTFPTFGRKRFNAVPGQGSKRLNCAMWLRRAFAVADYRLLMKVPELEQGEAWEVAKRNLFRWHLGGIPDAAAVSTATREDIEKSMDVNIMGNYNKMMFDQDGKYVWPTGDPVTEWWEQPGHTRNGYSGYMSDKEAVLRQLLGLEEPRLADVRIVLGLPKLAPQEQKRARKKNKKGAAREL